MMRLTDDSQFDQLSTFRHLCCLVYMMMILSFSTTEGVQ